MIREIKSYRWKPEDDKPIKKNDHAMDDLKYYIMSRPEIEFGAPVEQNAMSHTNQLSQGHLPHALRDDDGSGHDWHDL